LLMRSEAREDSGASSRASSARTPVEFLQHATGDWTLRFLVSPFALRRSASSSSFPISSAFGRMLGLFAFFYVSFTFSPISDRTSPFNLSAMWKDVAKRPFITVGFLGFVLLIPLAITSTAGWIRRLGGKRWQQLHRAIYVTAVCGVIHYYWLVKSDVRKPLFYGALVGILLLWRWAIGFSNGEARPPCASPPQVSQ